MLCDIFYRSRCRHILTPPRHIARNLCASRGVSVTGCRVSHFFTVFRFHAGCALLSAMMIPWH
jgi:hypothetical protein